MSDEFMNDRTLRLITEFVAVFGQPRKEDALLIAHVSRSTDWTIAEFAEWLRETPRKDWPFESERLYDVTINADGYTFHRPPIRA